MDPDFKIVVSLSLGYDIELERSDRIQSIINTNSFHVNEGCKSYLMNGATVFLADSGCFNPHHNSYMHVVGQFAQFVIDMKNKQFGFIQCWAPSKKYMYTVIFPASSQEAYYNNISKLDKLKAFI